MYKSVLKILKSIKLHLSCWDECQLGEFGMYCSNSCLNSIKRYVRFVDTVCVSSSISQGTVRLQEILYNPFPAPSTDPSILPLTHSHSHRPWKVFIASERRHCRGLSFLLPLRPLSRLQKPVEGWSFPLGYLWTTSYNLFQ